MKLASFVLLILALFSEVAGLLCVGTVAVLWPDSWGTLPMWPVYPIILALWLLAAAGVCKGHLCVARRAGGAGMSDPEIVVADMCQKHQSLLVHQANYSPDDTWLALIVIAQIALLQASLCDDATVERLGGDVTRAGELGCLACYRPDAFGEIVEAAKSHDLKQVKAVGERWMATRAAQAKQEERG